MSSPTSELSGTEQRVVDDLLLARRHARTLERLAVATLVLGVIAAILIGSRGAVGAAAPVLVASAVLWGLLRAAGLGLHLAVDRWLLDDDG